MWNKKKSENRDAPESPSSFSKCEYKWYDPGEGNLFSIRFLDVRSLTWSVVATTTSAEVAETFNRQRRSDGREFMWSEFESAESVACDLKFPHNGEELEGVIFKADSMDVKWDIYIYESVFLFVRSWTGQLQYRAHAEFTDTYFSIHKIETSSSHSATAAQAVYFLLGTHAMGNVLPHSIPRDTPNNPQEIAILSFSMYGNLACYATYEDITQIEIPGPDAD